MAASPFGRDPTSWPTGLRSWMVGLGEVAMRPAGSS
jgi:hypothetical protein